MSHASPILIDVDGEQQLVFHLVREILGLDPADGRLLWQLELPDHGGDNVAFTPVWDAGRSRLLLSYPYGSRYGGRALELRRSGATTAVNEVWANSRFRVDHTNAVLVGPQLCASRSRGGPAFLVCLDAESGEEVWRIRHPKVNFLAAGDRLLLLDEDGLLMLAEPTAAGLEIVAEKQILEYNAWTAPTLVGRRLYLRDQSRLVALDLPAG